MSLEGLNFEAPHEEPEQELALEDERVPGQLGEELGEEQREALRAELNRVQLKAAVQEAERRSGKAA
jgi:hypothetical protein